MWVKCKVIARFFCYSLNDMESVTLNDGIYIPHWNMCF